MALSKIHALLAGTLVLTTAGASLAADCPPEGSGAMGVENWIAANCNDDTFCDASVGVVATTCNNQFTVELIDFSGTTFTYEICKITNATGTGLSHFSMGLGHIACLGEGFTFADLVSGCTYNGLPVDCKVGVDPTTQLFGVKIDVPAGGSPPFGGCVEFSLTLNPDALAPGFTFGVGCVPMSTKAGNQDIRSGSRPSPGYTCVAGPVCKTVEDFQGCSQGFWKTHPEAWAATPYSPTDLVSSVFSCGGIYANNTLMGALDLPGGPGADNARRNLLRQAVAALLNASHPGVNYPLSEASVIGQVNFALCSGSANLMEALQQELDGYNNLHGACLCDSSACEE